MRSEIREKVRQYQFYILIAILSLICLFVLPFLGSDLGLKFNIPNTTAGWVVFVISNLSTATMALLIFHCFIKQAKINIKDNPKYLEANELLSKSKHKERRPRSPGKFLTGEYSRKGITLFISSLTAMIGLSNAVLNFSLVVLLSFLCVITTSIVFGIIEMNVVEDFWTNEYWFYAKYVVEQEKKEIN